MQPLSLDEIGKLALQGFGCRDGLHGKCEDVAATLLWACFDLIGSRQPCFVVWLVCKSLQRRSWSFQADVGHGQTVRMRARQHSYSHPALTTAVRQAWRAADLHHKHPSLPAQAVVLGQLDRGAKGGYDGCWLRAVTSALLKGTQTPLQPQPGTSLQLLTPQSKRGAVSFSTQCLNLSSDSTLPCGKLTFAVQSKDYWEPALDSSLRKVSRRVAALQRKAALSRQQQDSYQTWRIKAAQSDSVEAAPTRVLHRISSCPDGSRRASSECRELLSSMNDSLLPYLLDTKEQDTEKAYAEELSHLDRNYWRLKRLQGMTRGTSEHDHLAKRLIAKRMLSQAYLEPVFCMQLRSGRRIAVLLEDGQVCLHADGDTLEHAQMRFSC